MGPTITNNPANAAQPSVAPETNSSLAGQSFGASTNVASIRTNLASLATATALALGTNEVAKAQTDTNSAVQHGAPTTLVTGATNKIVHISADVLAGQPPAGADPGQANPQRDLVKIKQATVTGFNGLTTVYDGRGRELTLDKSAVPRERDSVGGAPSAGEVARLFATGIQDLKDKNGGVIPADETVVVTVQGKFGPTILPLNANLFPRPDRMGEKAFRIADRDQLNHRAITDLSREKGGDLAIRVTHERGGVATIEYNQPVIFELKKK